MDEDRTIGLLRAWLRAIDEAVAGGLEVHRIVASELYGLALTIVSLHADAGSQAAAVRTVLAELPRLVTRLGEEGRTMRELMGVALVLGLAAPALGQVPVTPAHRLAWDQAAHVAEQITRFELKIDGSLWGSVGVPTPTDVTFTVPLTKVPNGPHTLSVRACNVLGCGDPGPSVTVTMSGQASTPITPAHTLQWEQTDYATVTRFELDLDSAAKWGDIGKPPVSGATVTAPMPTMTTGKHTIAVRACNATGCGPASGLLTVDMAAPVPTTPSNLRATPKAGG